MTTFRQGDEWRPARASDTLKQAVMKLRREAGRPVESGGFGRIGDVAHQARQSDHNPEWRPRRKEWIVRAEDVPLRVGDGNGHLAERMRHLAKGSKLRRRRPHPAFGDAGYIISNGRIASHNTGWRWIPYHGADPHTGHLHFSWGRHYSNFDTSAPFNLRRKDVLK